MSFIEFFNIFKWVLVVFLVVAYIFSLYKSKKYHIALEKLQSFYYSIPLGCSKDDVDNKIGVSGQWVCTHYQPIFTKDSSVFDTYIWNNGYIFTAVFKDGQLVRKKIRYKEKFVDISY